jgi:hypothetical protein
VVVEVVAMQPLRQIKELVHRVDQAVGEALNLIATEEQELLVREAMVGLVVLPVTETVEAAAVQAR